MSYSWASRPIPTADQYSVWGDDRIAANERGITTAVWLCEFAGSRADCLRYLDLALISDESGHRMWGFAVYPPGTTPHHDEQHVEGGVDRFVAALKGDIPTANNLTEVER
jgi:hypothetical protein